MSTGKIVKCGNEAQEKVIEGVIKSAEVIKRTLGPSGRGVIIGNEYGAPEISRDGATCAKSISFKDQEMNMGAQLLKKAAELTEKQAGDGTSTCSVLTEEFIKRGQKAIQTGANVNEIKAGMIKARNWVEDYIKASSIKIEGDLEKIRKVATISANNDSEVGDLIVDCMKKVGESGVITSDLASGLETVVDITTGMKLSRGYASPMFVTSPEENKCELDNPYVIVVGETISSVNQIIPIIELIAGERGTHRPFVLIVNEMMENVLATLALNTNAGAIRACVVKGIDFGDARQNIMADIAVATGGKFISSENGISLDAVDLSCFGAAKKVIVSRDNTIILEGAGDKADIQARVEILKKRIEDSQTTEYDRSKFESRIANLSGGVAVVRAGGSTEVEKLNRRQTIDDAVLSAKAALTEGCCIGSGYIYLKAADEMKKDSKFFKSLSGNEKDGAEIIIASLPVVMKTVAENAGVSGDVVLEAVRNFKKSNYGYNAKTKKFEDLLEAGVLDSSKAVRVALENAISTAAMVLLIDGSIYEDESEPVKE